MQGNRHPRPFSQPEMRAFFGTPFGADTASGPRLHLASPPSDRRNDLDRLARLDLDFRTAGQSLDAAVIAADRVAAGPNSRLRSNVGQCRPGFHVPSIRRKGDGRHCLLDPPLLHCLELRTLAFDRELTGDKPSVVCNG
jgi:hypothetical protein